MTQATVSEFRGLYVQPNSFSAVPDGALEVAENVVVTYQGRLRKIRGIGQLSGTLVTPSAVLAYVGAVFVAYNSKIASVNTTTGVLTDLSGAVVVNAGSKPRSAEAGGNLYLATATGVNKIESASSAVIAAGIPPGLDLTITLSGVTGILAPYTMVGYRVVFGRLDANKNKVTGAPSELTTTGNTAAFTAIAANYIAGPPKTVLVTTSSAHGLTTGDTIVATGADDTGSDANGTYTVTLAAAKTFVDGDVTVGTDIITKASHGLYTGQIVRLTTTGVLPAGLALATDYWAIWVSASTFKLSSTYALAIAGTAVDITAAAGGGTHTATPTTTAQFFYSITGDASGLTVMTYGIYRLPTIVFTLPSEANTSYFYQIFRTGASASSTSQPNDDGQLIYEANLSAAQIVDGYVTFSDTINEIFKGSDLYTNPNQGGAASANGRPPFSSDLCLFRNCLLYANVQFAYNLLISLISVTTTNFLAADFVTITSGAGARKYVATTSLPASEGGTAATTPNTAATWDYGGLNSSGDAYFYLSSSSSTSVSVPIATTAKSLGKAINRRALSEIYARYLSATNDVPGQLYLVSKTLTPTFSVTASASRVGENFLPVLPISGTGVAAENQDEANVVYASKIGEFEAVPAGNRFPVGPKTGSILRIFPLRDSAIILTTAGVYKMTGDTPSNFQISLLDSTVICVAADSASILNNQVFFLSNQCVVAASESGVQRVSSAIEPLLRGIIGRSDIADFADGVGYESENEYRLCTLTPDADSQNVVYIFNATTEAWTTATRVFKDAVVDPSSDRLYLLNGSNQVDKERKDQNKLDYTSNSEAGTAGPLTGTNTAELVFSNLEPEVGDIIVTTGSEAFNIIASIDGSVSPLRYTFEGDVDFVELNGIKLYKPIISTVRTSPITGGDVSRWKQAWQFNLHFRDRSCSQLALSFFTDQCNGTDETTWVSAVRNTGWGYEWGGPWGGESIDQNYLTAPSQPCVTMIPTNAARFIFFQAQWRHSVPAEAMDIQAMALSMRAYGTRISR